MSPAVSVVIATYDHARFVVDAVRSVADQTFEDHEIIVADDGSTDGTADVLRATGVPMRYLTLPHRGVSAARNAAIAAATGRYVAFLDADDLWLPDKLATQVAVLDLRPEVGLVYADALIFDETSGTSCGTHADRFPHPSGRVLADLLFANVVPSPTAVVRRAALDRSGLFDETLTGSEDWDLWLRIAREWDFYCVPRPLATYRMHGGNAHRNTERMKRHQHLVLARALADPSLPAEIVRHARAAMASLHIDFGRIYFHQRDFSGARAELLRAVRTRPRVLLRADIAARLGVSLLGARAARWLAGRRPRTAGRAA
jgi:glycosyltransferase involved in cell wall biosynthesis